ncbi:MAG: sulfatase family protein [Planctomycetota bacterium]|jgi:uncharacterized sulfatase
MKAVSNILLSIGAIWGLFEALVGVGHCTEQDAPKDHHPNVVLIYTDDHAQWAVGAYGNEEIHTPNMDRLAAQGMRFTQGFTKPVCSPSRAMVLTGQYSHRHGIPDYIPYGNPVHVDNGLPAGTPTIASVLKRAGYTTGLVGKWHLGYGEKYYPENFGFDHAEGYRFVAPGRRYDHGGQIPYLVAGKEVERFRNDPRHTDVLADRAIHFLRTNCRSRFFLFLSIYLPHLPWQFVPEEDLAHYEDKPLTVPDVSQFPYVTLDEDELRKLMRLYYANITCADRNIGRVFGAIEELGLTENTIVIFIGDNGFNVGQHGLLGKGNARILGTNDRRPNMFDHSILVPLIVRWPGVVQPGTSSGALVSTIDILPTLMDITGAEAGENLRLDGRSMLPLLKGQHGVKWRKAWFDTYDMIYLRESHMRMIRTDQWKIVLHFGEDGRHPTNGSRHELFDLRNDPDELHNLYGRESLTKVQQELEQRLHVWMREAGVTKE